MNRRGLLAGLTGVASVQALGANTAAASESGTRESESGAVSSADTTATETGHWRHVNADPERTDRNPNSRIPDQNFESVQVSDDSFSLGSPVLVEQKDEELWAYVGNDSDGHLYGVNLETGETEWEQSVGVGITRDITAGPDAVYATDAGTGNAVAVDKEGNLINEGTVTSAGAMKFTGNNVVATQAGSGETKIWDTDLENPVVSEEPGAVARRASFANDEYTISIEAGADPKGWFVDNNSGEVTDLIELEDTNNGAAIVSDVIENDILVFNEGDEAVGIEVDMENGEFGDELWRENVGDDDISPMVKGNQVFGGNSAGEIYRLIIDEDGESVEKEVLHDTDGASISGLKGGKHTFAVRDQDTKAKLFDMDGEKLAELDDTNYWPVAVVDGKLIVERYDSSNFNLEVIDGDYRMVGEPPELDLNIIDEDSFHGVYGENLDAGIDVDGNEDNADSYSVSAVAGDEVILDDEDYDPDEDLELADQIYQAFTQPEDLDISISVEAIFDDEVVSEDSLETGLEELSGGIVGSGEHYSLNVPEDQAGALQTDSIDWTIEVDGTEYDLGGSGTNIAIDPDEYGLEEGDEFTITVDAPTQNHEYTFVDTLEYVEGPPPVVGTQPPQDLNGDGKYEDIDGDGEFDIFDVQALFNQLDSDAVQNHPGAFNFDEDETPEDVTIFDVQGLFNRLKGWDGPD